MNGPTSCRAAAAAYALLATLMLSAAGCSHMARDPLSVDEHMRLGASYEEQGMRSSAAKEYGAALRKQKAHVPALVALGNLSFEDGSLVEAEIYYRKALAEQPEHPGANNNLAVVFLTRGSRLDTAEQLATKALGNAGALKPYVLDTLAHIYMKQGRFVDAKVALDDAERDAPPQNGFLRQRLLQSRRKLETYGSLKALKGK